MIFSYRNLLRPKDYDGQPVRFCQIKHDGTRILLKKDWDGSISMWTRDGRTDFWPMVGRIPAISKAVIALPENTCLDCELHCPGVQATSVITLAKAASDRLELTCFAAPFVAGEDLRRMTNLKTVMGIVTRIQWPWVSHVGDLHWSTSISGGDRAGRLGNAERLKDEAVRHRFEGYMLKHEHYDLWYKVKPVRTADLVVLSVTISDSLTHFGKLKAIQVGPNGGDEVASVGSGFDQEWRHSVDPATLVGRVAEVAYDSLAANGKLKFPRFVRWRDDKQPSECDGKELNDGRPEGGAA